MVTAINNMINTWHQLQEACRSPESYLAEDNRWWPSVLERQGPHGLEEGKR